MPRQMPIDKMFQRQKVLAQLNRVSQRVGETLEGMGRGLVGEDMLPTLERMKGGVFVKELLHGPLQPATLPDEVMMQNAIMVKKGMNRMIRAKKPQVTSILDDQFG